MSKYADFLECKPIGGYWITYDTGFLIYEIDAMNNKILVADNVRDRIFGFRKNEIHYDKKGNAYFCRYRKKIFLNECLRID